MKLCISKADVEKFGGDVKTALVYSFLSEKTHHGNLVAYLNEYDIMAGTFGLMEISEVKKAIEILKSGGYIRIKKAFGNSLEWYFDADGGLK